jgi:putative ABC transport system permease protein
MTADVLPMLGVAPAKGRVFSAAEEQDGSDHVAVISHRLWQRRFGGDPSVVGRTLSLNGEPYAVVGVMPEGFRFAPFWATRSELWAPLSLGPRAASRNGSSLRVFARRKPDVGLDQARAEMAAITGALEREFPGTNRDVSVLPLKEKVVGDIRPALLVLLGAVGLVLLISCANVAHLLLARGAARQREVAGRAALGASRGRILRQMLTESLVLSLAGAALGVGLASLGLQWLLAMAPASIPRLQDVSLDARVLLATLGIALLTGVAFGIVPAFESAAPRQEALREDARSGTGRGHARLRRLFVASEVALALVLMVGAGLLMRSFLALRAVDPGFDPRHVLTMVVSVGGTRESAPERRGVFYRELLERVSAVPGVRAVSAINHLPLAGDIWGVPYAVEGRPEPRPGESPMATYRVVFPGYFRVMGIPILRGRDVASQDDLGAPGVVVVNQFLASHQWPGEDAVGKRIRLDDSPGGEGALTLTVIGVVKDSVQSDWRGEPADEIYLPWLQNRPYLENPRPMVAYTTLVARADGDPAALFPALRVAIASLDPALPVSDVITMERVVADANADSRFQMLLLGLFAAVATVLASTGIYAVMSYAVSRRTREIGVRMAFGAGARQVLRLVIGEAMGVALVGALAGIVGAFFATRLMAGILYGVGPSDPATYASVALLLLAVSLLASYLPARRALGVSPLTALRQD